MPIFSLITLPPTLSVWPSISMKPPFGSDLSLLIISSILAFASSGRSVLPNLNWPSSSLMTTVKTIRFDALSSASVRAPTSVARAPAVLASLPAVLAACCAASAAPCAACVFVFTSLIAPSFFRVRSWVSSTDCVRLSTLLLTSPTLFRTNFLVAHAGRPTATTPASVSVHIHFDIPCLLKQLVMTGRWLLVPRRTRCVFVPRTSPHARGLSADASLRACPIQTTRRTDGGVPTGSVALRRRTPHVNCLETTRRLSTATDSRECQRMASPIDRRPPLLPRRDRAPRSRRSCRRAYPRR